MMCMTIRWLAMVSLIAPVGCGKKETPPAATTEAGPATHAGEDTASAADAEDDAGCIDTETSNVMGELDPDFARLEGNKAVLCGDTGPTRHCVALDLDSGERSVTKLADDDVEHLPAYPPGFADGLVKDDQRPVLKLCSAAAAQCKDLHVGQSLAGHFDADGERVVVTSLDDGTLNAHVYDAASQERRATVPIAESDLPDCTFAAFVGDRLLLSTGTCTGKGKAWLADSASGDEVADIGGREDAFVLDGQFTHVDGDVWAFREARGERVYLQDVTSGAVRASIDVATATDHTKPKDDAAFVLATADQVVLIEARPLVGTVIVANAGDGGVVRRYIPRPCR